MIDATGELVSSRDEENVDSEVLVSSIVLLLVPSLELDDVVKAASDVVVELDSSVEAGEPLELDVACTGSKSREKLVAVVELPAPEANVEFCPDAGTDPDVVTTAELAEVSVGS